MYVNTQIKLEFSLPFVCERARFLREDIFGTVDLSFGSSFNFINPQTCGWIATAKISFYILDEYSRSSWKLCDRVPFCVCCWL